MVAVASGGAAVSTGATQGTARDANPEEEGGRRHRVEMRRLEYTPKTLNVAPGDTVVWVNLDFVPHTVTANDSSWDSGEIGSNEEWEMQVSEETSGDYFCRYHPSMVGELQLSSTSR